MNDPRKTEKKYALKILVLDTLILALFVLAAGLLFSLVP
jgi:hypothetical protein